MSVTQTLTDVKYWHKKKLVFVHAACINLTEVQGMKAKVNNV